MFTAEAVPGLADGSITVTFRNWKRPQAKVGGRFHKGDLWFEVDAVDVVPAGSITKADARRAGATDPDAVRRRMQVDDPAADVYRIRFHRIEPAGPPVDDTDLSDGELAELDRRLDRLGDWARPTLELIAAHPGVVSTTLAELAGRDRPAFKLDVRKLKKLGLTLSLEVGYQLSPRGRAYLDARR